MPGLNGILKIGVPIYTMLLGTMAWRAISRVQSFEVNFFFLFFKQKSCSSDILLNIIKYFILIRKNGRGQNCAVVSVAFVS